MSDVTYATSGGFPVVDITHHSKRTQEGNLKGHSSNRIVTEDSTVLNTDTSSTPVPRAVTLENAIDFYANAKDKDPAIVKLFSATANWLTELLKLRADKRGVLPQEETDAQIKERVDKELSKSKGDTE